MEITLIAGKTEYKVHTFYLANKYAYHIWELDNHSNLEYYVRDNNFYWQGSIDLEPRSFHQPHKRRIVTTHITTVCHNLLKENRHWLLPHVNKYAALELLSLIPNQNNL
jgi:hypothetical protein